MKTNPISALSASLRRILRILPGDELKGKLTTKTRRDFAGALRAQPSE